MSEIQRRSESASVAIAINTAISSTPVYFGRHTMMVIHMPAAWTAASLAFKVGTTPDVTKAQPLYKVGDTGTAALLQITTPAAATSYVAPAELAPGMYVWLWSQNGSGTNTNQEAARAITLTLKA